ncbi:hypothetical protein PFICI_07104 [Pestalotiopsis fici W106-1]|uniref:Transcription factor PfmaH n=1 Tax=Pestalotiopsis fici (strain W106-1 / CGMCC3.15140) TaxID=1229662 RepID=PFMAH_PESFW|nr:uncharacterized protein PFICI_07104 [Pestalotiopsis fici W106-1]W3X9K7.1 RecName: Full=Transcription factor PfmaH; AltName: Full=Conidial pigment biosynthesis cluster protein H [Pestalotiopsis fici W106-1]ETS82102.1 hypothetical protein PFICI_07104 [Pestalotiopsis fici W106-1]
MLMISNCSRDLLQRHFSNYHDPSASEAPVAGAGPSVAGKTPIACLNCSQAKTGCNKEVPCQRCQDKGLHCVQRYARRTSKLAARSQAAATAAAAQASRVAQVTPVTVQQSLPNVSVSIEPSQTLSQIQPPLVHEGGASVTMDPAILEMPLMNSFMKQQDPEVHDGSSPANSITFPLPIHLKAESPRQRTASVDLNFNNMNSEPSPPSIEPMEDQSWVNSLMSNDPNFGPGNMFSSTYDLGYQLGPSYADPTTDFSQMSQSMLQHDASMSSMEFAGSPSGVSPFGDLSTSNSEPSSSSWGSSHTRATSICSAHCLYDQSGEFDVTSNSAKQGLPISTDSDVILTEAAWPMARCTPPIYSGACPRTALGHLQRLEQKSSYQGARPFAWHTLERELSSLNWDNADLASVVPMNSQTRDSLMSISQRFHARALDIHRENDPGRDKSPLGSNCGPMSFLNLPSSKVLEFFMKSYVRSLTSFYSLVSEGRIDPNQMHRNDPASIILMLLMIAQGASAVDSEDARILSMGLIETCRISLLDIIDKNVEMSADPTALRAALLFAHLGAWSGDKWLMDIAMGQRGMYISMLKHAGMLTAQPPICPVLDGDQGQKNSWRLWLQVETKNRLVYDWVMVDQELSLFHDTDPQLDVSELRASLPCSEKLWKSSTVEQWADAVQCYLSKGNPHPLTPPSLYHLYREFLEQKLVDGRVGLTAHQLRLLLHPIQKMLCQQRQTLTCFSDMFVPDQPGHVSFSKAYVMRQVEVVRSLLSRWHDLAMRCLNMNPDCTIMRTNMVLYHLISLNAVTNFPEIESFARQERYDGSYWGSRHQRCIYNRQQAVHDCGQVFSILRNLPTDRLPTWWSAAIYRATMILWADSALQSQSQAHASLSPPEATEGQYAMNAPQDFNHTLDYNVIPYVTRSDGTPFHLDRHSEVLDYAICAIDQGASSRLGEGIKRKLIALGNNWH